MCTNFRLNAKDGAIVVGRTMEFPNLLGAKLAVVPVGVDGASAAPEGAGASWTGTHGYVGVDAFGNTQTVTDGLNDAGLSIGLLYMPGFATYQSPDGVAAERLLAPVDVAGFLLATCATVDEVRTALADKVVWPAAHPAFGFAPPHHVVAHDRDGGSLVVEWVDGEQVAFDNPNGVATNWPHLDWHLTNLRNYLGLRPTNVDGVTLDTETLAPMGQGTGLLGLPGDPSSVSRFIRASVLRATLRTPADAAAASLAAGHLLNALDIPAGLVREDDDPGHDDHTLWSVIVDLTNLTYTIRTYEDPTWRQIALSDLGLGAGAPSEIALPEGEPIRSLS